MWDPENFPGADHVPWQLLIRARFAHEIDVVIASHVVKRLAPMLSVQDTARLAESTLAIKPGRDAVSADAVVSALSALADFDDICPPPRPWPWPWPWRRLDLTEKFSDPISALTFDAAIKAVGAGSPGLNDSLGGALSQLAGGVR